MLLQVNNFDLNQIAKSGQCFRWQLVQSGGTYTTYNIVHKAHVLTVRQTRPNIIEMYCSQEEYLEIWEHYFDFETDYGQIIESIDQEDNYLVAAANAAPGIHILNQDPWETMVSFIVSQRNSIPRIKATIEKLCERYGNPIPCKGKVFYTFPTPDELKKATLEDLESIGLYYRAEYLMAAVEDTQGRVDVWASMTYQEAFSKLIKFKGIGPKVANCICLFGMHFTNAFPVDTWVKQITDKHYGGYFPVNRYPHTAGIMQQYMFYYERKIQGKL